MEQLPKGMKKIVEDAKAKGYIVVENLCGSVDIKVSPRGVGLTLWPNGQATRNDIDLSIATAIRTQKVMRSVLEL